MHLFSLLGRERERERERGGGRDGRREGGGGERERGVAKPHCPVLQLSAQLLGDLVTVSINPLAFVFLVGKREKGGGTEGGREGEGGEREELRSLTALSCSCLLSSEGIW